MRSPRLRSVRWLPLLLLITACGSKRQDGLQDAAPIVVHVDNQHFSDATVYLFWGGGGGRHRLGAVTGKNQSAFTTRWLGPSATLEFSLLAGRTYRADPISVNPGDELILEVPVAAERFIVRRR